MKLRELFEAPGKTAVVAFGRMNPPTIGHAKLVDKIKSIPGDHLLFLSQTQNAKDNPLSFDQKVRFAKASFQGIEIGNKDVRTPIDMMQKLEGLGYTDIVYVAGSDRVSSFEKLFPKYNGTDYDFNSIEVVSAGERDPDAEGAEGMSASKMRKAAIEGNFEAFQQGVANPRIAKEMYDAIRQAMGIQDEGLDNALGGSVDEGDVIPFKKSNPANPRLDKDAIDAWNKERNQKMAQDMIKLAPEVVEYYKELKDQDKDTETAIDIIAYDFDIDQYDVKRILQANNIDEDATPDEEDEFHRKLDKLVHKTFGHSSDEKKKKKKKYDEADLNEIAPAVGVAAKWIIKWAIQKGAWSVLKWILKKYWKKIAVGTIAYKAIDEGWDWVKGQIGEEMAQMLIDNGFEIGMAVALIIGAVMLKRWVEKHGEKFAARYAEGDTAWMN